MIKIITIASIAVLGCFTSFGQQADSTVTKPVPIDSAAAVKSTADSLAQPVKTVSVVQDSVITSSPKADVPPAPVDPLPSGDSPRIIYYQDSKPGFKNKNSDIKTLSGSMNHSGGFFGLSFRASEFNDEALVMGGFRTGWIINRTLGIGFEGHGVIPTGKYEDIDPQRKAILVGGYGGMFMEFIIYSNQVVHVTFPLAGGSGWLAYNEDWKQEALNTPGQTTNSGPLIDQDFFWYVEPGASIEMNISRIFRLGLGVSRRFVEDFDLVNTKSKDFEKMNVFLTLKLGKF